METTAPVAVAARPGPRAGLEALFVLAAVLALNAALLPSAMHDALIDPDEGRTGEIAREMNVRRDYFLPHLETLPYLDKPFLPFALVAAAIRIAGPSELAVRLPTILCTSLAILLVGWWARRRIGPGAGAVAAWATASSPLVFFIARTAIPDGVLLVFTTTSFVALYEAMEAEHPEIGRLWTAAMWFAVAFGVLAKGPIAVLLPLLAGIPYGLWRRRARRMFSVPGLLGLGLVVGPWVFHVSHRVPDFLHYALVTETFERLTTSKLRRTGSIGYFVPFLLGGCFPWSIGIAAELATAGRERLRRLVSDHLSMFLLAWIAVPFIFFSISQSKRPHYVLPLVPAVSILYAQATTRKTSIPGRRTVGSVALIFGALFFTAGWSGLLERRVDALFAGPGKSFAIALGTMLLLAGVVSLADGQRFRTHQVAFLAATMMLVPILAGTLTARIAGERSMRELAQQVRPALRPETRIVSVRGYWPSLSFYLQRTTVVSSWDVVELTSNYARSHYEEWIAAPGLPLRGGDWWIRQLDSCSEPMVFIVMNRMREERAHLAATLPLLAQDRGISAFGPCQPAREDDR